MLYLLDKNELATEFQGLNAVIWVSGGVRTAAISRNMLLGCTLDELFIRRCR
jgi:branched-subunit amino acid aminotransferase/4-amino-4-deoxychorismate lyase